MGRGVSEPRQCLYWRNPRRVRDAALKQSFELMVQYEHDSHLQRELLKCRECSQLYFFEFYEIIDWENGNDPQYTKYIPVSTIDEGEELSRLAPFALLDVSPRLCIDFPKEAKSPTFYWVTWSPKRPPSVISSVWGWIKGWLSSVPR